MSLTILHDTSIQASIAILVDPVLTDAKERGVCGGEAKSLEVDLSRLNSSGTPVGVGACRREVLA